MTERYLTTLEARREFGNLVLDAQAGKTTVITRYGTPAAIIAPLGEQHHTVELASGDRVTLGIPAHVLHLSPEDREFVFDLIERVQAYEGGHHDQG